MIIFISDGNKRFIIEANENDTIKTLKEKIKFQTGENERIKLLFRGKILEDYEKISKYSIKEMDKILMIKEKEIYFAGGDGLKIFIRNPRCILRPIEVISSWRVFDLKEQIKNQEELKEDIELLFNGIILEDSQFLSDVYIKDGDTIDYTGIFRAGCPFSLHRSNEYVLIASFSIGICPRHWS